MGVPTARFGEEIYWFGQVRDTTGTSGPQCEYNDIMPKTAIFPMCDPSKTPWCRIPYAREYTKRVQKHGERTPSFVKKAINAFLVKWFAVAEMDPVWGAIVQSVRNAKVRNAESEQPSAQGISSSAVLPQKERKSKAGVKGSLMKFPMNGRSSLEVCGVVLY